VRQRAGHFRGKSPHLHGVGLVLRDRGVIEIEKTIGIVTEPIAGAKLLRKLGGNFGLIL
jgi:hypothetical protein